MQQNLVWIIENECQMKQGGREADATNSVALCIMGEIRLLEYKGKLTGFNVYIVLTRLVSRYSGTFTSDIYEMADNAHRLAFLGNLLRKVEESFILTYGP